MTTDKPKRGSSPLTPTAAADRIATALGELPDRIVGAKAEAEAAERAGLQSYVTNCIMRVPAPERDKVARVLLVDLRGYNVTPYALRLNGDGTPAHPLSRGKGAIRADAVPIRMEGPNA